MAHAPSRAGTLLAAFFACTTGAASPLQIATSSPITCAATPFGPRLALGLEQEYVVLHAEAVHGVISGIHDSNVTLDQIGTGTQTGITPSSAVTTHIDLDGDGRDEWAVAGVKSSDAHTLSVTIYRRDPANLTAFVAAASPYEFTATANIVDLKIAAADVTGRSADARQELVIAYRDANASGNVHVLVVNGTAASPNIQQVSNTYLAAWSMPGADAVFASNSLRLATGDVLLEGRDQIVLMAISSDYTQRIYYLLRYNDANAPLHLGGTRYVESRSPQTAPAGFDIKIADFGGTPAAEMVIHDQTRDPDGVLSVVSQEVKYFTTTRDSGNNITGFAIHSAPGTNTIDISGRNFVVAAGELDRQPGAEIVLARQRSADIDNHLLIELYKVGFDASGHAASIGAYLSPIAPNNPIVIDQTMYVSNMQYFDVTVGQPHTDGIGEVAVAVQDLTQLSGNALLKVRTYAMARPSPNPNVNPDPATFALTGSYDYATTYANTSVHIDRVDFEGDSVLADIGSECLEVREPQLRSVVHLPPYWQLLQGTSGNFLATIGKTSTSGTTADSTYGTFTSHDISGYVGVKVGGEVMGIGAEASAKVTAGYNYESSRGESYGTENSFSVSESQQQNQGEGLVVEEDNTFDCYSYTVHSLGSNDPGSNVRSCELIRYAADGHTELRGFTASDMVTWDTDSAYNSGLGLPAQWVPLAPDWASVALFRQPTVNFGASVADVAKVTDGLFGTSLVSPSMTHPYVQIDLGSPKALTNVRVFPASGHVPDLNGFSLYVSSTPFGSGAPPSGTGVSVFASDPNSGNGYDHWNVWLRNPATQAPLVGRYLRLQSPGAGNKILAISELQAFADVHIEPPQYPVSVCDTVAGDGLFSALMYNAISAAPGYQKVEVRGDLLWKGTTGTDNRCGSDAANVKKVDIFNTVTIGGSGTNAWDLSNTSGQTVGSTTSISQSARVGAEFDVEAGAVAKVQAGGAYEFSTGVTEENSTTMYWQSGIEYAGQVGGFSMTRNDCEYRAQPFAYTTSERSNVGYQHQYTVVDYFVPDFTWNRAGPTYPPTSCYAVPPDRFFYNGFE